MLVNPIFGTVDLSQILVGITLAFLPIAIFHAYKIWKLVLDQRVSRSIFRMSGEGEVSFIFGSIEDLRFRHKEKINYTTPTESIYFSAYIRAYLDRTQGIGRRISLQISKEIEPLQLENDLVIVGGPINNEITKRILASDNELAPIYFENYTIVSKVTGKKYSAKVDEEGRVTQDYCALVSMPNPWAESKWIVLFCGSRAYGSIFSSNFVFSGGLQRIYDALDAPVDHTRSICVILTAEISHLPANKWKAGRVEVKEISQL